VQAFFRTYYAPNNAVLTVAGDFDAAQARRLIQRYYGDIPRVADAPAPTCQMQFGTGARRVEMTDNNANLPLVAVVYKAPAVSHEDAPALELLTSILADGESGRLNLRLVRGERAAMQSGGFGDLRRSAGIVIFYAINNQGVETARVERLLGEEIERIRTDSIPQAELTKAQNQYRAGAIRQLQTGMGVAETLQNALWNLGSLEAANQDVQRHLAVTTNDLHRAALRYLAPENRLTVIVNPPARGGN
jgi:zinc protease